MYTQKSAISPTSLPIFPAPSLHIPYKPHIVFILGLSFLCFFWQKKIKQIPYAYALLSPSFLPKR